MRMESAFDEEVVLDSQPSAWEIESMAGRVAAGSDEFTGFAATPRSARLLCWLWLLVACVSAGLACRGPEERGGSGGQSGDEGRRSTAPWMGTGGVTSVPARH